jgi:hypothetical protein
VTRADLTFFSNLIRVFVREQRRLSVCVQEQIWLALLEKLFVWINRGLARLRRGYGAAGVDVDLGEQCPVRFRNKIVTLLGTTF